MKGGNGDMLVNKRLPAYFEGLLNVSDNRVATVTILGSG